MLSKIASLCMIVAGVCHLAALGLSGFAETLVFHLAATVLLLAMGFGVLRNGSRLLRWLSFLVLLVLSIATLGQISEWNVVPSALFYAIAGLEWLAIVLLFLVLWMRKPMTAAH